MPVTLCLGWRVESGATRRSGAPSPRLFHFCRLATPAVSGGFCAGEYSTPSERARSLIGLPDDSTCGGINVDFHLEATGRDDLHLPDEAPAFPIELDLFDRAGSHG